MFKLIARTDKMKRSEEITRRYFAFLEKHIQEVIAGTVPEFLELNEIAGELAVSHKHLTDTIKKETGQHPCYFYDEKIIEEAKKMLVISDHSVAEIARIFTYDPSNFSKFFKKMTGLTPGQFRISSKA
ncbi:AraC family transcriptional regulator [Chryseobacterium arthrosphaerae]|uniref:AraC family transcriptional regulator n=2 Tax=Chryseobacterium arthrosphaerae TaxID=651561 RepID=A0A1B8ZPJ4_9FLAO|nr:AraC family transcriptional regulator [Chryseobacterium arthrosphaerae]AYZ11676.1 AraC family transcriptional regulator [Chryseobacterium arthrosphaerae]OCA73522.1 DNA-binding protein [Chryseobacterium arthrosphaerae]